MNYSYEQNLMNSGFEFVCGIDEAGRGALAGPLVAAAIILDERKNDFFHLINDSKLLNKNKRQEAFSLILQNAKCWAIGVVSHEEIDQHGLGFANKIAMKRAWKYLRIKPDYILSDYLARVYFETPFELIVDGDKKIISVAAASIVAKVIRDRMMEAFARYLPNYHFEQHKGYGTEAHLARVREFGLSSIHRKSFAPFRAKLL